MTISLFMPVLSPVAERIAASVCALGAPKAGHGGSMYGKRHG